MSSSLSHRATTAAGVILLVAFTAGSQVSRATTIDPIVLIDPNFSVCQLGTTNVNSCGPTDPQQIDNTGASVGVIGGGGSGPLNPFLLFAVVPDLPKPPYPGSPTPAPVPGTSSSLTISLATSAQYGQTKSPTSGYLGEFTSSSPDLYSFAGLAGGNASMNFPNLSGTPESSLFGNAAPTSFSVYEFTVTINNVTGNLGTSGVYDLPFTTLTTGTYLAAWGIEDNPAKKGTHVYASPFTTAGLVGNNGGGPPGSIPEPRSVALIGIGLLALAMFRRKPIS